MLTLLVAIEARPGETAAPSADRQMEGYYQTFGVTAFDEEELHRLIREYLYADLQSTLIQVAETWVPDLNGRDRDIKPLIGDIGAVGIWYRSGRAWFREDDDQRLN